MWSWVHALSQTLLGRGWVLHGDLHKVWLQSISLVKGRAPGYDKSKASLKISHMHDVLFIELKATKNTFRTTYGNEAALVGLCESGSREQVA